MDEDLIPGRNRARPGRGGRGWLKFWLIFLALAGLVFLLNREFGGLEPKEDRLQLLFYLLLLGWLSSYLAFSGRLREHAKHAAVWLVVATILLAGYSYRFELNRIKERLLANLMPDRGFAGRPGTMAFSISADGHYYIRAEVDGQPVRFLVDTGSSDIVITPQVARKLGYDLSSLPFNRIYQTANGIVRGSNITLADLTIGPMRLKDVPASVNRAEMNSCLLGMTFFNRLQSYRFENDRLVIQWSAPTGGNRPHNH